MKRWGGEDNGAGCLMGMDFIPGAINILKLKTIVTLLNVTGLCTLKCLILCYMNLTSVKKDNNKKKSQ